MRLVHPTSQAPHQVAEEFLREHLNEVAELEARGLFTSARLKAAVEKVVREAFIQLLYRDYAYLEVPLPLQGKATISCPYSYHLFYEALKLDSGHRFLEVSAWAGDDNGDKPGGLCLSSGKSAGLGYSRVELVRREGRSLVYPSQAPMTASA